jgi:hypothetical protein
VVKRTNEPGEQASLPHNFHWEVCYQDEPRIQTHSPRSGKSHSPDCLQSSSMIFIISSGWSLQNIMAFRGGAGLWPRGSIGGKLPKVLCDLENVVHITSIL